MARARNIKPGFFKNYDLADAGPQVQLLFSGLWCLADREGRLEDKPRFIKAELFPYYDFDVNGGLTELERLKFICRYLVDEVAVIQVLNFDKHQSPHKTEKASSLPSIEFCKKESKVKSSACIDNGEPTVNPPLDNDGKTPDSLIPDSLIPDSLIQEKEVAVALCEVYDELKKVIAEPERPKEQKPLTETDMLKNAGIDGQLAKDFLKVRKAKRAPLTQTAMDGILSEAGIAGITVIEAVTICVRRSWQGFNAGWDWQQKGPNYAANRNSGARQSPQQPDYSALWEDPNAIDSTATRVQHEPARL